jgi:hypothetical protein
METTYLVVFNEQFPIELINADIIQFPLDRPEVARPAMHCISLDQGPAGFLELVPSSEIPQPGQKTGSILVHQHHVLFAMRLVPERSPAGFQPHVR